MKQNILITFFIIFAGCNFNPERQKIMVNKTVKVFSSDYHDQAENYTFKWEPPMDPNNKTVLFDLKNDMLIFSPTVEGSTLVNGAALADIGGVPMIVRASRQARASGLAGAVAARRRRG